MRNGNHLRSNEVVFQYIHTKGAFWPGNVFINQEKVNIPPNVSVEVKFQPFINEKLDDEKCIAVSEPLSSYSNQNLALILFHS